MYRINEHFNGKCIELNVAKFESLDEADEYVNEHNTNSAAGTILVIDAEDLGDDD